MNIIEEIDKILKEIDKDKQRIIIHPFLYNKYKDKFDQIKKEYYVVIIENNLIPADKIIVMESERDSEERMFNPLLLNGESR